MRLLTLPLLAALLAAAAPGCARPARPPSLLLVSLDTLRPDRLACYGAPRATAPSLDALAARGALLEDVSAPSPWTLPSHASLLTGLYPARHGVSDREHSLGAGCTTLAERLAAAGYRTHAVVNAEHVSARYGLGRGFEAYDQVSEWGVDAGGARRIVNRGGEVTARGLAWLEQAQDEPFFLFLHYYDAHTDLDPDPRWREAFAGAPYPGAPSGRTEELLAARAGARALDARDAAWLRDLYDAEVRTLDEHLARLFRGLAELGLAESTLVVVTSDHGEEFLEHGSLLHGRTYYQEVIAIPLLLAGPGVPAGVRVAEPVGLVDVAPTALALLGQPPPEGLDGRDLSPLLRGASLAPQTLFAEADHNNTFQGASAPGLFRMARRGAWKLVRNERDGALELYDLAQDPRERAERSAAEPARAAELAGALERFRAGAAEGAALAPLSPAELERLRALGY